MIFLSPVWNYPIRGRALSEATGRSCTHAKSNVISGTGISYSSAFYMVEASSASLARNRKARLSEVTSRRFFSITALSGEALSPLGF